jgi:hypothetical protein
VLATTVPLRARSLSAVSEAPRSEELEICEGGYERFRYSTKTTQERSRGRLELKYRTSPLCRRYSLGKGALGRERPLAFSTGPQRLCGKAGEIPYPRLLSAIGASALVRGPPHRLGFAVLLSPSALPVHSRKPWRRASSCSAWRAFAASPILPASTLTTAAAKDAS